MKYTSIPLILGLLIPGFVHSKSTATRIKELEEAAYLKTLELQRLAKQIKEICADNMIIGSDKTTTPYMIDKVCDRILQKLNSKGIKVSKEDLVTLATKEEVTKAIEPHKKLIAQITKKIIETGEVTKEAEQLATETSELVHDIDNALVLGEGQFVYNLSERLFDKEEYSFRLNIFKFSCVHSLVEIDLLHYLVNRYQICFIELLSIKKELSTLKLKENK